MTREEWVQRCFRAIEFSLKYGASEGSIAITRNPGSKFPPGFPRGEFVSEDSEGGKNYAVSAYKLLGWVLHKWPEDLA